MENRQKIVLARVVTCVGLIGTAASIWGLQEPARWILSALALIVVVFNIGFLMGISGTGSLIHVNERRPPESISDQLGNAEEVWCAWHAGTLTAIPGGFFDRPRHVRMILTRPDAVALKELKKIAEVEGSDWDATIPENIRKLTEAIKDRGGQVAWFDGPIQNSTTIADPKSLQGWAMIELIIPNLGVAERPSIKVFKEKTPELFTKIVESFGYLWKNSDIKSDIKK